MNIFMKGGFQASFTKRLYRDRPRSYITFSMLNLPEHHMLNAHKFQHFLGSDKPKMLFFLNCWHFNIYEHCWHFNIYEQDKNHAQLS